MTTLAADISDVEIDFAGSDDEILSESDDSGDSLDDPDPDDPEPTPAQTPVSLSGCKIKLGNRVLVYTGKRRPTTVTVTDPKMTAGRKKLTEGVDYTLKYSNHKNVGVASVTITGMGAYTGTVKRTYKIIPRGTYVTGSKAVKNTLTLRWKKRTSQLSGYKVQYSTDETFATGRKTITIKGFRRHLKKLKSLEPLTTYYVRVRTFKKKDGKIYYSRWSKPKKTSTKEGKVETVNVLMIGNSLTRNCPMSYLQNIAAEHGYKLHIEYVAYSAECLETYANAGKWRGQEVRAKIRSRDWDYIVLQQHTDRAFACYASTRNAIKKLDKYIKKHAKGAKVFLNCTWPYSYTRSYHGKSYSYSTQLEKLNSNYERYGRCIGAEVIYSGKAFNRYRKKDGTYNLYRPDGNHATYAGYYLNACCIFAKLFGQSPYKTSYNAGLGKKQGYKMQEIAGKYN